MKIEFTFEKNQYAENLEEELELSEMTPGEIMDALNKAPSKFAYWSSVLADIMDRRRKFDLSYELWYAGCYSTVEEGNEKKTEGWKKNEILLQFANEYTKKMSIKIQFSHVQDKCKILIDSFGKQIGTLQSIGALKRLELRAILSESATGNLEDT